MLYALNKRRKEKALQASKKLKSKRKSASKKKEPVKDGDK